MAMPFSLTQTEAPSRVKFMELVHGDQVSTVTDGDVIRIGSSEICEIQIENGPPLHSVIRSEDGVIWIEADVVTGLRVNDRSCHRMALRDGDTINANGLELILRLRDPLLLDTKDTDGEDDVENLEDLSAEELCDRILEEQTEIQKLESTRQEGWQDLLSAIKSVHETDLSVADEPLVEENSEACERLLDQIREMSEIVNGRSMELDDCEAELLAATALLHETQDRIAKQIEELLDQIGERPFPNALRASA